MTRTFKTSRWLWFLLALFALVAIGFLPWFDMGGHSSPFGLAIMRPLLEALSGRAPSSWIVNLLPWLLGWIIAAVLCGWCLHGLFVIGFSKNKEPATEAKNPLQAKIRIRNALYSATASFLIFLCMALWIGGMKGFISIVRDFMSILLAISAPAGLAGACLKSSRVRMSLLTGALFGLAGGTVIVLSIVANI